jgi:DNA-binding FrmR family transcriptional regulator
MGVCFSAMSNTQTPGYKASKEELLTRLARVEGQVRGVTKMVEEERYCIDVLTQIEAAEAALDKVALGLLDDHVRNCMRAGKGASEKQVQELMGAVGRLVSA